ncbi:MULTISPECIES: Crp/Fnr family transcriptional regulator [Streptomyces]|uniref:Cyclic nucleotide-binding domain-containing protein n=1 Tax=Streptomyces chengmaiensis TaxID=3040919 RepID=A0ABT6HGS0_9ACTN|nr:MULTISPECIES: cyclic nucleotide-binding domain-containing protein [Streptomyces]MDH2387952.1 cyclic nucleotide-binding domain-containing protein [Streptomyces chengmaiensis]WRQ79870.1 cyclic nucleotide-binding domain-containing protein [Streptomyces sp. MUM 178J]
MTTPSPTRMAASLPAEYRARLMATAREVGFPENYRIFEEGQPADHFWIIRSGTVTLDFRVPGGRKAVIDSLGFGELVGWSWLYRPYVWQLGAEAMTPVRAHEFDAEVVRMMMDADPAFGSAMGHWIGRVLSHRLHATRVRLLDLYAPHGSGS